MPSFSAVRECVHAENGREIIFTMSLSLTLPHTLPLFLLHFIFLSR